MTLVPGFNRFSTSSINGGPLSKHLNADTEFIVSLPREAGTLSADPEPIAAWVDADAVCEIGGLCLPGADGSSIVLGGDGKLRGTFVKLISARSSVRAPPLIVLGGPAFFAISASSVFFNSPAVDCLPPTIIMARSSKLNRLFGIDAADVCALILSLILLLADASGCGFIELALLFKPLAPSGDCTELGCCADKAWFAPLCPAAAPKFSRGSGLACAITSIDIANADAKASVLQRNDLPTILMPFQNSLLLINLYETRAAIRTSNSE